MKRFLCILMIVSLSVLFCTVCCAEEINGTVENVGEITVGSAGADDITPSVQENVTDSGEERLETKGEEPGFFDRIGEYISSGQIFQALCLVAAIVMLLAVNYLKKMVKTLLGKVVGAVSSGNEKLTDSSRKIESAFEKKADELKSKIESLGVVPSQIEKLERAVMDLADMFDIIYQGSSTIPAVIKNRVAAKHDHAVKLLEEASADLEESRND